MIPQLPADVSAAAIPAGDDFNLAEAFTVVDFHEKRLDKRAQMRV